jgi:hypothetical protein
MTPRTRRAPMLLRRAMRDSAHIHTYIPPCSNPSCLAARRILKGSAQGGGDCRQRQGQSLTVTRHPFRDAGRQKELATALSAAPWRWPTLVGSGPGRSLAPMAPTCAHTGCGEAPSHRPSARRAVPSPARGWPVAVGSPPFASRPLCPATSERAAPGLKPRVSDQVSRPVARGSNRSGWDVRRAEYAADTAA